MPETYHIRNLFKSNLFSVFDYRCSGGRDPQEEWSDALEIIFPRYGSYYRRDAFGSVLADPNQILFTNRNQSYDISHPAVGEDRSTVILLETSTLLEIARSFEARVEEHPDRPFPLASITTDPRLHISLYSLLNLGMPVAYPDNLAVEEFLFDLLEKILALVFNTKPIHSSRKLIGTVREHVELVHRVKLILGSRFMEQLLLDDIAAVVFSSPYHLSRVFKQETGITIHQYQQRLRLLHAAELLVENPFDNLDRLALNLGFVNHSHFTTTFGKMFKLTPSDFRLFVKSKQLLQMSKILKA